MVIGLDGLVRDPGDAAVDQRPRERLVGGDVEIGEEHAPHAEPRVLGLDRLLDLEEEVGLAPCVVDRDDPCARSLVLLVGKGAALPRRRLDENLVPALDQLACTGGRERHAILVGLDLLCDSNSQSSETLSRRTGLGMALRRADNRVMPRNAVRRRLATVLFLDIVGSTALASELGDARWRELL